MRKRKREKGSTDAQPPSKRNKDEIILAPTISSADKPTKKSNWINKERVLIFASRGISHRDRHLMLDLRKMMPHSKSESKMDRKDKLFVVNEMCEMKNCNKCIFFEAKKKQDLYMWLSNCPRGPSVKFLVENVHTMQELKMTGNCLKGSRPLLSFDKAFDKEPHWNLMKELFIQVFSTPNHHPKSQPFLDHVFTFSIADNRIWFRNYQILEEDGSLAEIGPRFVVNPIRVFDGSFGGSTLYMNPHYISPNEHRRLLRKQVAHKYIDRIHAKKSLENRKPEKTYPTDITDDVFLTARPDDEAQNG